jgi:hypothetical protein
MTTSHVFGGFYQFHFKFSAAEVRYTEQPESEIVSEKKYASLFLDFKTAYFMQFFH